MPVFDYHCPSCGSDFERLVRRFDDPTTCPNCGCDSPTRLMSAPAAHGSDSSASAAPPTCPASGKPCCSGCCGHQH